MDPHAFADPWEHARLLSDVRRNATMLELLRRHAPERRVLEVGCGTGLLSLVAARMGAEHVYAVEPTALADVARELVRDNHLGGRITVIESMIEDLDPRPVDLAWSELLNADPFVEGVVSAMRAAADWIVPGGRSAPRRLRVLVAPVHEVDGSDEVQRARAQVDILAERFGLGLGLLDALLATEETSPHLTTFILLAGDAALAFDLTLDRSGEIPESAVVTTRATGLVEGIAVWFEAELDDDLVLGNGPGTPGHWGHQVYLLAEPIDCGDGLDLTVLVETDDDGPIDLQVRQGPRGTRRSTRRAGVER